MTPPPTDTRRFAWLLLPLLLAAIALAYWPGLTGGFALDDVRNITKNAAVQVTSDDGWTAWRDALVSSPVRELPRPLAMLTFAANHATTGLDPWPMKLTNLAVHLLNVLLVYACTRQLLRALPGAVRDDSPREAAFALAVAAMWGLHPINLMAVLYVVQRMESLAHTCVLAGLWLYLHGRLRQVAGLSGWPAILAGLVGGSALGAMAKESALLLPLYAVLAEAVVLRARGHDGRQPGLRRLYAAALVAPALAAVAITAPRFMTARAYANRDFDVWERLLTEGRVVLDYLHWTVLPNLSRLGLHHDDYAISHGWLDPPSTVLAFAALALLAVAAWALRRRRPLLALGVAWFLGAQVMTASYLPLELVFEHRNYFASFGVMLALADLLLRLPAGDVARRSGALVLVLYVAFLGATTHLRAREWSDPMRFAATEAQKHPHSPRATYGLAAGLVALTGYRADSPYAGDARRALERAIAASGDSVLAEQAALIHAARSGGELDPRWWQGLEDGLRRRPRSADNQGALTAMGACAIERACAFPPQRMIAMYGAAVETPNAGSFSLFGTYALHGLGDAPLALRLWREAAKAAPRNPQFRLNLAQLLLAMGHDEEAAAELAQARRLGTHPRYHELVEALEAELARRRAKSPTSGPQ